MQSFKLSLIKNNYGEMFSYNKSLFFNNLCTIILIALVSGWTQINVNFYKSLLFGFQASAEKLKQFNSQQLERSEISFISNSYIFNLNLSQLIYHKSWNQHIQTKIKFSRDFKFLIFDENVPFYNLCKFSLSITKMN